MGLRRHNITDGEQYAALLIEDIRTIHAGSKSNAMEDDIINYWCEEIKKASVSRYQAYIEGELEDFMFTDEDLKELYEKAISSMIGETLEALVEKGDVAMGVDSEGEIVYQATEKGKKRLK